jgi:hypothetical protein
MFTPWELVDRYRDKGVYEGYILYSYDTSEGGPTAKRKGIDESANVATTLAGVLKGIMVSEEQQGEAEARGLKMLADAREMSETECFETYRDRLDRRHVLAQDPKMPNHRAIAVAHNLFTYYGDDSPTPELYAWLDAPASILGWNAGDEGDMVAQLTEYGHTLLASNWALNETVTSAGSDDWRPEHPFTVFDPRALDWEPGQNAASFVMSDGDNVQWLMGDFCLSADYWASRDHGRFPVGWGLPHACLAQVCPAAVDYLAETQRTESTLNLHAGGYYYPDLMGIKLPADKRWDPLRTHARRINHYMQLAGATTLQVLCMDVDSEDALKAYQIYADEIENLTGIFVLQYYPYEGGDGEVFWVKNRHGEEIPVLSSKFTIWANVELPGTGTPSKVARLHREAAEQEDPLLCYTIAHTWSGFKQIEGDDDKAENSEFRAPGTEAAVTPARWCADRLGDDIRVVSPEELLWRIRMEHNPDAARRAIDRLASGFDYQN